ncbi:Hypothetical predicted protein, partial [Paramuricea clavata]
RTTKYFCNEGYLNADCNNYNVSSGVGRKCNFDGEWEHGAMLNCKRICPKLDEIFEPHRALDWNYSASFYFTKTPFDGMSVQFVCNDTSWELIGPETIACNSSGNYSVEPPTCKKRPVVENT